MNHARTCIVAIVAAVIASGAALGQSTAPAPAPKSAPAASGSAPAQPSTQAKVETWTKKQWAAAQLKWSKNKANWADCQQQSKDQNLSGRKSWSFLYDCMISRTWQ